MKNYFDSDEFKHVLSRYEKCQRAGTSCYLDADDFVDISDYYLDRERTDDALKAADEGLRQHPDDELLPCVRAGVLMYQRRLDEAEEIVKTLNPDDNYDVYYLQGQLAYAKRQDADEADRLFSVWLERLEDDWLSSVEQGKKDPDDEDAASEEEAEEEVRNAYLHVIMTYAEFSKDGQYGHIKLWIARYLDRCPDMGQYDADYTLADLCRNEELMEFVEVIYQRLLDNDPYMENGWAVLAAVQQVQGKLEEALESLNFALAVKPNDDSALLSKAHCLYALGNYAQALPLFLSYRERHGHSEDLLIAYCYSVAKDKENALRYLDSAMRYETRRKADDPEQQASAFSDISEGYRHFHELGKATRANHRALDLCPHNTDYLLNEATLLLEKEKLSDGLAYLQLVIQKAPSRQTGTFWAADRLLRAGYVVMAAGMLRALLDEQYQSETFPEHDVVYAELALADYAQEQYEEMCENLEIACEKVPEEVKRLFAGHVPASLELKDYADYLMAEAKRKM